jgi:aminopeptidase N
MWINEGFARYGEYLCYEALDPTLQKYNTEIRKLHGTVISNSICREYALDNVPPTETYNSTLVYDKGGWTAFTLRNYMGDDLFFSSITQFLDENRYGNVDSEEFFNKLSDISGMDLSGFYLAWVHQPGFLNFNIDSVKPIGNNKYEIAFKQRLYYAPDYTKNYSVDVVFVSSTGATSLKKLWFSGESDIVETELPFEPVFWAINPYFKRSDICYDYTETISSTGNKDWGSSAYFSIKVDEIDSESIIRIEYNPFTPTTAKNSHPDILRISERRFWRIGFLKYNTMQALYSFSYNSSLDKELLNGYTKDNLVLLYRKDAAHDWQIIPATVTGSAQQGKLETTTLLSGEYTLGISDKVQVKEWEDGVEVYPNPATGELIVTSYELQVTNVEIFDVFGRKLSTHHLITSSSNQIIDISRLPAGTYILEIVTTENIIRKKFIKL